MQAKKTVEIIKDFYHYYNHSEFEKLFSLIDENIIHEMNYEQICGKDKFIKFIKMNKKHYDERIDDYILMLSEDGKHATTKFIIKSKYLQTDGSYLPANGQFYEFEVLNYFEITDDKIIKGFCWYNEKEWAEEILKNKG